MHAHRVEVLDGKTITQLSRLSRMTSSSNSFHPMTDSSTSTSEVGL